MKTLLLLGSNSDVGQAVAYEFARQGFSIYLATRRIDQHQNFLASDIQIRHGVSASTFTFDALKTETHQAFYHSLPTKPDVVVSVFGYNGNQDRASVDFAEANTIIQTNFTGNVSILEIIAGDMEQRKSGTIIAVSSVAGERGRKSNYTYGAAKAALTAFLSGLRNRLTASGVHVCTVIPGFIKTKMLGNQKTPGPITATPQQVARSIWKAYKKRKNTVYVLPSWRWIMLIIRNIPEGIFKKLNL